jgi:hypothetical protein
MMDCKGEYAKDHDVTNYLKKNHEKFEKPIFCGAKLNGTLFEGMENVGYSPYALFGWIKHNLYLPLGYKVYPKFNYPDVLNGIMDLEKRHSMIHAEMQIPNKRDFARMVDKTFDVMANASIDLDNNRGQISNIIVDLLKKFHIYWNVLRMRH